MEGKLAMKRCSIEDDFLYYPVMNRIEWGYGVKVGQRALNMMSKHNTLPWHRMRLV